MKKETASSSDVTGTNEDTEDTEEDESNHSIAQSFDEPSSENQDSVSDHNYVNATTELNNEDDIKPSANVKEVITLIYLNAEGISWTNLTSLISVHSQHLRKHLGKHVLLIEIVSNKKVHHKQYHQ